MPSVALPPRTVAVDAVSTTYAARRRGLTVAATAALELGLAGVGGLLELTVRPVLGVFFAVALAGAGMVGAAVVRPDRLRVALVLPPLVWLAVVLATSALIGVGQGRVVAAGVLAAGTALLTGFPTVAVATAAAGLVVLARYRQRRRDAGHIGVRRARPPR